MTLNMYIVTLDGLEFVMVTTRLPILIHDTGCQTI